MNYFDDKTRGIGLGAKNFWDETKKDTGDFFGGVKDYFKSGGDAMKPAIGQGTNLGLDFKGLDSIKDSSDTLLSFGTDSAGSSIGGVSGGQAANAVADAVITGDVEGAATNLALQTAGTAAGTAIAGPVGGMIGGALASSLMPKKKKPVDPDAVHLI